MSYITVSAEKVLLACSTNIIRIHDVRKSRDESKIAGRMLRKKYIWFGPNLTYAEAKESLLDEPCSIYPSIYAWGDLERLEKLQVLAQNGDPVTITADDAFILWGK